MRKNQDKAKASTVVVDVKQRKNQRQFSPCRATSWTRATLPARRLESAPQELADWGPRARRQSPAAGAGSGRAKLAESSSSLQQLCARKKKKKKKESARCSTSTLRRLRLSSWSPPWRAARRTSPPRERGGEPVPRPDQSPTLATTTTMTTTAAGDRGEEPLRSERPPAPAGAQQLAA